MEITGEYRIPAARRTVWEALNDPEVLRVCIPGCESLEKVSDTEFTARVNAKVGPVKAKFGGKVTLSDFDPPNSYRIAGEGQGGVAGFAKGSALVTLTENGGDTVLSYDADAQVGGKLAQIGSRLIAGTARKMADDFFGKFAAHVSGAADASGDGSGGGASSPEGEPAAAPGEPAAPAARHALPPAVWTIGLIVLVAALLAVAGRA